MIVFVYLGYYNKIKKNKHASAFIIKKKTHHEKLIDKPSKL